MKWSEYVVSPYTRMQDGEKKYFLMGPLKLSVKLNSLLLCAYSSPSKVSMHFHGNQIAKEDDYLNTWCRETVFCGGPLFMHTVLHFNRPPFSFHLPNFFLSFTSPTPYLGSSMDPPKIAAYMIAPSLNCCPGWH